MPLRRALAAILALPVLATIYLSLALRRGPAAWLAMGLVIAGAGVVAAAAVPAGTTGAPIATQAPLAATALGPAVETSRGLQAAMIVDFDAPMDRPTAEQAVRVDPPAEVDLGWSSDGTRLFVEPVGRWRPATYYTITVGTGAQDRDGRALASPLRVGFLTREATTATLAVMDRLKTGIALDSSIALTFDRPVDVASVLRAFRVTPAVAGQLIVASDGPDDADDPSLAEAFLWEPDGLLTAKTDYSVGLADGVLDAEGAAVPAPAALAYTTTEAPSIVRFRPRGSTKEVARAADVSVRFTMPMERAATKRAFRVEVNGKTVQGAVRFAEDDTVLVFDPEADFPYGAKVVLRVREGAQARGGTPLDGPRAVTFSVEPKPKPKATPKPTPKPTSAATAKPKAKATPKPTAKPKAKAPAATRPSSSTSLAAEKYLLAIMNRTRAAKGVPALQYHAGVSNKVARPYAKKLALSGVCSHFYGSSIRDRLRAAGYTGYQWGENLGCRYFADPRDAAESLVRFFKGSPHHYANMMGRQYSHAGIGLWVSGHKLRFVVVFYSP